MGVSKSNTVWEEIDMPRFPRLTQPQRYDVVVVGGGATGLSTALLLKEAGLKTCVLERGRIGEGETGNTTAHLTCVTDTRLTKLVQSFGRERAALTWYAGLAALDIIKRIVDTYGIDCEFRHTPGFLHASLVGEDDEAEELKREAELAQSLGIHVDFVEQAPIVHRPAIRIPNQAKFHPTKYLAGIARAVDGGGCAIYELSEAAEIETDALVVIANGLRIECERIVIATHVPLTGASSLLQATALQSKLAAYSTYVISGRLPPGSAPDTSLWDTSNPYYYMRVDAKQNFERVIFGGKDHKTGQESRNENYYRDLEQLLQQFLPAVEIERQWSGQVISTPDGLPYIGESSPRQFVATGFNGNGITFGTIAGLIARDAFLGRDNPWSDLFSVDRKPIRGGIWNYVKENLDFPYFLLADWMAPQTRHTPVEVQTGEGKILSIDGQRAACARDAEGQLHVVSAICPHLGCLVRWNPAEQTWDCPCHGSRFLPNGKLIAGPAETPLAPIESTASPARKATQQS